MRPRTSAARPLRRQTVLSAVLLIALTGCGAGPGTEAQIQTATTSTSLSPPAPSSPTMISEAPVSPTSSASPTDEDPMIGHQASPVHVFWVLEGGAGREGGPLGCGDSLVMSSVQGMDPALTGAERVEAAIEALLAQRDREVGERGLTTALHHSDLTLQSAELSDDTVTVHLTGQLTSAGTCDDPRIIGQLEQTALVNAGVSTAHILMDGTPVQDLLSTKD